MISLMLVPASSNSKLHDECSHGNGPPTRSQASSCPGPARGLVNYVTVTRPQWHSGGCHGISHRDGDGAAAASHRVPGPAAG
jgi:hypothetical protein